MSQYNAPGGGIVDSGDKRIQRKVVVSTSGDPTAPGGTGRLTNVSITNEPAGIKRGVFEYTSTNPEYGGGKRIELLGGSREVPIYNHPNFKTLNSQNVIDVQNAAEARPIKKTGFPDNTEMDNLYQCLIRGIEYYIAPSLIARVSEIESGLPSVSGLCKLENPTGVGNPGSGRWILTGINATPVGDKYEVTREYTYLEQPQAAEFLYD